MKENLNIPAEFINDEYSIWKDEETGMTFPEFLREGWKHDLTYGCILDTAGMISTPNYEEWEAMNEEERKMELEKRFQFLFDEAASILGITREELDTIKS